MKGAGPLLWSRVVALWDLCKRICRWLVAALKEPSFAALLTLGSVYFAWQTVEASRDAMEASRKAGRPVLRLQQAGLAANTDFPEIKPHPWSGESFPEGETKLLKLDFVNAGQRAASGINISIAAQTTADVWKTPPSPSAEPETNVGRMVCPMLSFGDDIFPGDSVSVACPVYVPAHEFAGVVLLYTDLKAGGGELCQYFALQISRDGTVRRASQFAALAMAPPNLKCGPREPEWLKRARVSPWPPKPPAAKPK